MTTIISGSSPSITFSDGSAQTSATRPFLNRIINGAMVISQRNGTSTVTPASSDYLTDRWNAALTQSSKFSSAQSTTAPTGYINSLICTSLSAYSITATDIFGIRQYIEGLNISDLAWGTASAATVTLSFQVRSSLTGTFGGSIQNSALDRSYPFTYTINAANTWEQKSVTIAGDTSGTWLTTNGVGMRLLFGLGVGSTYSGTAGAWAGADYRSATGATSVVGTNGATFYITGVQLEVGSTATSFDYRPYGTELALCQRYCEVIRPSGAATFVQLAVGQCDGTAGGTVGYFYQTAKRAAPTVTYDTASKYALTGSTGSAIAATSITTGRADTTSLAIAFNVSSGLTAGNATRLMDNNNNNPVTIISAEL